MVQKWRPLQHSRAPTSSIVSCSTAKPARLGIIATGKAYLDLRQALADLGITEREAQKLGLRIYKVGLTWPLEESGARRFAEGLQDVLVVEEKRGFIEDQLVRILYNMDASSVLPSLANGTNTAQRCCRAKENSRRPWWPPHWSRVCAGSANKVRC